MKKLLLVCAFVSTAATADVWGDAADGVKHAGGVMSDGWHHAGGVVSDATKAAGAGLSDTGRSVASAMDGLVDDWAARLDPVTAVKALATHAAAEYYEEKREAGSREDCTLVVAAVCGYYASYGGPFAAGAGAAGGAAVGDWACGSWYP